VEFGAGVLGKPANGRHLRKVHRGKRYPRPNLTPDLWNRFIRPMHVEGVDLCSLWDVWRFHQLMLLYLRS